VARVAVADAPEKCSVGLLLDVVGGEVWGMVGTLVHLVSVAGDAGVLEDFASAGHGVGIIAQGVMARGGGGGSDPCGIDCGGYVLRVGEYGEHGEEREATER